MNNIHLHYNVQVVSDSDSTKDIREGLNNTVIESISDVSSVGSAAVYQPRKDKGKQRAINPPKDDKNIAVSKPRKDKGKQRATDTLRHDDDMLSSGASSPSSLTKLFLNSLNIIEPGPSTQLNRLYQTDGSTEKISEDYFEFPLCLDEYGNSIPNEYTFYTDLVLIQLV